MPEVSKKSTKKTKKGRKQKNKRKLTQTVPPTRKKASVIESENVESQSNQNEKLEESHINREQGSIKVIDRGLEGIVNNLTTNPLELDKVTDEKTQSGTAKAIHDSIAVSKNNDAEIKKTEDDNDAWISALREDLLAQTMKKKNLTEKQNNYPQKEIVDNIKGNQNRIKQSIASMNPKVEVVDLTKMSPLPSPVSSSFSKDNDIVGQLRSAVDATNPKAGKNKFQENGNRKRKYSQTNESGSIIGKRRNTKRLSKNQRKKLNKNLR